MTPRDRMGLWMKMVADGQFAKLSRQMLVGRPSLIMRLAIEVLDEYQADEATYIFRKLEDALTMPE